MLEHKLTGISINMEFIEREIGVLALQETTTNNILMIDYLKKIHTKLLEEKKMILRELGVD